jgi:hypothetical protein
MSRTTSLLLVKALQELRPNSDFAIYNDDIGNIVWQDVNIVPPTKEEISKKFDELYEISQKEQYKELRKNKYPSIEDQLDMLWHMMDQEIIPGKGSDWYNTISEVKSKYSKP